MQLLTLFEGYVAWHYSIALRDYFRVWGNILWFLAHFFSLSPLLKTLISPWRRLGEQYPSTFDPAEFLAVAFVNFLMRVVGFFIRLCVLLCGGMFLALAFFGGLLLLLMWLVMPSIPLLLIVAGSATMASNL
jgi:hypothetical protein